MTAKPVVYLINLSAKDYERKKNKWLPKIAEWIKANCPGNAIPYSVEFESEFLANNPPGNVWDPVDEKSPSKMGSIIRCGFKTLDL